MGDYEWAVQHQMSHTAGATQRNLAAQGWIVEINRLFMPQIS